MSIEANKAALRRAISHFSADTLESYLQFYHPNAKLHFLPPGLPPGRDGARIFYQGFLAAFPDARIVIADLVSEEDKIALRFTIDATHRGDFMGIPATGRRVSLGGITIMVFEGNQCVERWSEANIAGLLQQLSAE
jgi:predicted ester cyclase